MGDDSTDAASHSDSETGAGMRRIVDIEGGGASFCALFDTGAVKCWGYLETGTGGIEFGDDEDAAAAPDAALAGPAAAVAVGGFSRCALSEGGSVSCWGTNYAGQLGYPGVESAGDAGEIVPAIDLGAPVIAFDTSWSSCGVLADGRVRCFGMNGLYGNVGLGIDVPEGCAGCGPDTSCCLGDDETELPSAVLTFAEPVTAITVGVRASCAVLQSGALRCWGDGPHIGMPGVVTHGDDELASDGPDVAVGGAVSRVDSNGPTCAVLVDGPVRCWGYGSHGELGLGDTASIGLDEPPTARPPIPLPGPALDIGVGYFHVCALVDGGGVWCWGDNSEGAVGHPGVAVLGDDEPADSLGPVDLGGPALRLAASDHSTCALLETGRIRCWGANRSGELGYGHTSNIGDDETPASAGDVPIE